METLSYSIITTSLGGLKDIRSHNIGRIEGRLCTKRCLLGLSKLTVSSTIRCKIFSGDDATNMVVVLSKQTCRLRPIGRTILISITIICLILRCTINIRVPRIPLVRVVDIVSQHVTLIVADIVRGTEDEVEIDILISWNVMHVRRQF